MCILSTINKVLEEKYQDSTGVPKNKKKIIVMFSVTLRSIICGRFNDVSKNELNKVKTKRRKKQNRWLREHTCLLFSFLQFYFTCMYFMLCLLFLITISKSSTFKEWFNFFSRRTEF